MNAPIRELPQAARPADIAAYIDGALLVDLWDELVLLRDVRDAWAPAIAAALDEAPDVHDKSR